MISDHIKDIITAADSKPKSEWNNRAISHLKSAYACMVVDETGSGENVASLPKTMTSLECTCYKDKVGIIRAIDSACPLHGV